MPIPVNVVNGESFFGESVGYTPFFPYVLAFLIILVLFLLFWRKRDENINGVNSF